MTAGVVDARGEVVVDRDGPDGARCTAETKTEITIAVPAAVTIKGMVRS